MQTPRAIRILLAEDHELVRTGFRQLLGAEADLEVVGEAGDGLTAVRLASELKPDVVLMDISLPKLNGIDATRRIREDAFSVKVIGLSMHNEHAMVEAELRAGAAGYVLKDCGWRELVEAIHVVHGGGIHVSESVADGLVENFLSGAPKEAHGAFTQICQREREVLHLIAEGLSTREIAEALDLCSGTVSACRARLMKKLDIHTVAGLTRFALRQGLVSP